jgi:hypothetical protein
MYNRILNRPMFKLGGKTNDAQGTGITSGLDTPRQRYDKGDLVEQLSAIDVGVPESTRKRAFWTGIGQGFGSNPRTLGEALNTAVGTRDQILGPAEAKAAERGFELEKAGVLGEFERGTLQIIQKLQNEGAINVAKIQFDPARTATGMKIKELKGLLDKKAIEEGEYNFRLKDILSNTSTGKDVSVIAAALINQGVDPKIAGKEALKIYLIIQTGISMKKGGRVSYQLGATNQGVQPVQASLNVDETIQTPTETIQEDVSVQEGPQSSIGIPYPEFRAKMPPEVDDEIVQLIYYNEDAFADFAQITNQAEVYEFNNKWGVSLVLPMDTEIA